MIGFHIAGSSERLFHRNAVLLNKVGPAFEVFDHEVVAFQRLLAPAHRVHRRRTTQPQVLLDQRKGIFLRRDDFVLQTHDVQHWNLESRHAFQVIERNVGKGARRCFGQTIQFQPILPIFGRTLALALAARPTARVADGRLGVDTGHLVGIALGPAVGVQSAPTDGLQRYFEGELLLSRKVVIELIPNLHGLGMAEEVVSIYVG